MNNFTTELVEALVQKKDIQEVFRIHLEAAVNQLLQIELTSFLNYEKYERVDYAKENARNGTYTRTLHTEYGDLELKIPRDRQGEFQSQTVQPYKRSNDTLESMVIHLFQKGLTMSEISDLIEKMYGHHYTPQTISNMTQSMSETLEAFHNRPLQSRYVCIYLDATYIHVRRDSVEKEAVSIALGIREDGTKEILDYMIFPTESAYNWKELLTNFKERGVEDVLLFISDGLKGMSTSIAETYPKAKHQTCLVHVMRNIAHKVKVAHRAEACHDFKKVYQSSNKIDAKKALDTFCDKWKQYPKMVKSIQELTNVLTFYDFPEAIRPSLYSTNVIESFNKHLKRYTKRKEQFPNEASLDRFLVALFVDYNDRFDSRCHRGFKQAQTELAQLFDELHTKPKTL